MDSDEREAEERGTVTAATTDEDQEEGADQIPAPVHYSTGRLTGRQAGAVNKWRTRLQLDKPLPGQKRKDGPLRFLGIDNRPACSSSDVIAAAVCALLAEPPTELEIAHYAERARLATRAARESDDDSLPRHQPVSFYLPPALAEEYERLRVGAWYHVTRIQSRIIAEADEKFPDRDRQARERRAWIKTMLREEGIPEAMALPRRGLLGRMAIDRWTRRAVDKVMLDAVAYASDVHDQPHRARRDMIRIRR